MRRASRTLPGMMGPDKVPHHVVVVAVACPRTSVRFDDRAVVIDFIVTTPMDRHAYPTQMPREKPAVPFAALDAAYESASIVANAQARPSAIGLANGQGKLAPCHVAKMRVR